MNFPEDQSREACLAAVQRNGYALLFVKEQTEEICLAAVQRDGWALEYVKNQTPEICLAACLQMGQINYVRSQKTRAMLELLLI